MANYQKPRQGTARNGFVWVCGARPRLSPLACRSMAHGARVCGTRRDDPKTACHQHTTRKTQMFDFRERLFRQRLWKWSFSNDIAAISLLICRAPIMRTCEASIRLHIASCQSRTRALLVGSNAREARFAVACRARRSQARRPER